MRVANVYMNNVLAGRLTEHHNGSFSFRYDNDYFSNPQHSSISLTLPKSQREHSSETLFPFFFNMLSEGVNKHIQIRKFKIDEDDGFGLLMATAHSDVIGAVTIKKIDP
ncbi:MAG: HipA N-terminal domain-containing protein [Bacteroidales bacterium]|nr:HipA N-terminal domain-containing protein [Bacteroidales bacterium]